MKHINSWIGKTLAFVLCVSMLAGVAAAASAASNSEIDFSQTGSITLSLETGDGSLVSGGTVTLYAVATLYLDDGDMAYAYTEAFSGCEATLDASDTSLPAALAAYAAAGALAGTSAQVSDLGTVCFEDLALGLYLLVQTEASENYETINPFVVTIPMDCDGEWVYAVDASPKVGTVTPVEATEPEETEPEETTPDPTLPQTGQLNWPIPVLVVCALLLFALGWALKRFGSAGSDA